jgi:signal peptidase I
MTVTPTGEQMASSRAARRRRARRQVAGGVAVAAALGISGGLLWLGNAEPVVTVMSPSMSPKLHVGDIALMQRVRGPLHVGDIVSVRVPAEIQASRNYPSALVHRIVSIEDGMVQTKGDDLGDEDPFTVPVEAVNRKLVTVVPGAGRALRFAVSPFGILWIGSGVVFLVLVPMADRSRERREDEQGETKQTLQHVVAAVADYGYHLQSHTEILKAMSAAAQDLSAVASRPEGRVQPITVDARPTPPTRSGDGYRRLAPITLPSSPVVGPVRVVRPVRSRPLVAASRRGAPAHPVRRRPLVASR